MSLPTGRGRLKTDKARYVYKTIRGILESAVEDGLIERDKARRLAYRLLRLLEEGERRAGAAGGGSEAGGGAEAT